jgi:hypothetical protein
MAGPRDPLRHDDAVQRDEDRPGGNQHVRQMERVDWPPLPYPIERARST